MNDASNRNGYPYVVRYSSQQSVIQSNKQIQIDFFMKPTYFLSSFSAAIAMGLFAGSGFAQAQIFSGAVSSDPTVQANYSSGTAPTFGGTVSDNGTFQIENASGNPFDYTSSLGTTVFNAYIYSSGTNGNNGLGTLNMQGGTVSFGANLGGNGSQNVFGDGLLNVSGGTINFLNGNVGDSTSLWIGNNTGNGTANISGGTLITQNGLLFGRDGANGNMTLTGGLVNVQGSAGSIFNNSSTLTFGLGNGVYEQTGSGVLTLNGTHTINFLTGTTGEISLSGATQSYFAGLVTAGQIQVNGATATISEFSYSSSGGQGIYQLAAVSAPEPSTWALVLGGLLMLSYVGRRRSFKN